jgi:hypothetical protein
MLEMLRAAISQDPELAPMAMQLARALYFGGAAMAMRSESTPQMELEVGAFARAQIAGARVLSKPSRFFLTNTGFTYSRIDKSYDRDIIRSDRLVDTEIAMDFAGIALLITVCLADGILLFAAWEH